MNYDDADEIRDSYSLNEFLAAPTNSESIAAAQYLCKVHPDQLEPRYLVFSMQIDGEIQRFSLLIAEEDSEGDLVTARAEELAEELGAERLYHGHKVFMKSFRHEPQGDVIS